MCVGGENWGEKTEGVINETKMFTHTQQTRGILWREWPIKGRTNNKKKEENCVAIGDGDHSSRVNYCGRVKGGICPCFFLLVWPSTIQLKTAQFFFSNFEIKNVKGIQKVPKKFTKKWRDRWCNMETTKWKPKNGEHTTTKLKKQNGNQPHTHTQKVK